MGVQPVGGAWTPSNYAGGGGGTAYPLNLDAMLAVLQRMGQCFNPHQTGASGNMTVSLDAGFLHDPISGTLTEVAAQTTGVITAPISNPRIDRVVVDDATGAVSVITGTENVSPMPPAIPPGKRPVAQVLLQTSTTAITNTSNITDERAVFGPSRLLAEMQAFDSPYSGGL